MRTATKTALLTILADGGPGVGFGHVGRCLALWEQLEGQVAFAVRNPTVVRMLESRGVSIAAPGTPTPLLLVDRRAPTATAEMARMHGEGARVCLVDDRGEGRADADLLVDPPTGSAWPPTRARRLAGFEHVLLRRDIRAAARHPSAGVEVLLSMGAGDPEALTLPLAVALHAAGVSVLSVLGPLYRGAQPPGAVLGDLRDWPGALAGAKLLVGRFGHTLLEAAHLGTPALAIAGSQPNACDATLFASHGTAEAIRVDRPASLTRVVDRVIALLADPARLTAMGERGRELVDGRGATRVAAALKELA